MGNIQQKKGRDERDIELELYVQNMRRAHNGQGNPIFTCQICVKPMQSNQIFNNKNKCAHAVCKDCIAKYIQDKTDTKDKVPNIQCPGLNCNQFLEPLFCRKIIQKPRCFFMNFRCGTCFCEDNSNKREDLRRKCIQQQKRMKDNSHKSKGNQRLNVSDATAVSVSVSVTVFAAVSVTVSAAVSVTVPRRLQIASISH